MYIIIRMIIVISYIIVPIIVKTYDYHMTQGGGEVGVAYLRKSREWPEEEW